MKNCQNVVFLFLSLLCLTVSATDLQTNKNVAEQTLKIVEKARATLFIRYSAIAGRIVTYSPIADPVEVEENAPTSVFPTSSFFKEVMNELIQVQDQMLIVEKEIPISTASYFITGALTEITNRINFFIQWIDDISLEIGITGDQEGEKLRNQLYHMYADYYKISKNFSDTSLLNYVKNKTDNLINLGQYSLLGTLRKSIAQKRNAWLKFVEFRDEEYGHLFV
jgi:hypothetical protein